MSSAASSIGSGIGGGTQVSNAQPLWSIGQTGLGAAAAARGINIWAQGAYTRAENTFNAGINNDTRFKGDIWAGSVGVDYRVAPRVVVGLSGGYQNVDIDTTFNAGKLKQTGWGVTPYAVFGLNQNYFIDVSAGYWWLDNEMSRNGNTAKANYDGTRYNLAANLNGGWSVNQWRLTAAVGYLYVSAKDDAFRETGTAAVAAQQSSISTKIGQGRIGGTVGYALGAITPYALARVEHNFEQDSPAINNGVGAQPKYDRTGYRTGVGLRFAPSSTVSGDIGANTVLGKRDQKEYTIGGTIRLAF